MAAVLLTIIACGASPTTPTSAPPLLNGDYILTVLAPDATSIPACPGAGPAGYSYIMASAIVTADSATSVVQPRATSDGDFELRLARGSGTPQFGVSVSGSIRGVVVKVISVARPSTAHPAQYAGC